MKDSVQNIKKEEIIKCKDLMEESEQFLMKCLVDHEKNTANMKKEDVLVMALKIYKSHLRDLIYNDM